VTFSDDLRADSARTFDAAGAHRLVDAIWAGRTDAGALGPHLAQQVLVLDAFVGLLGATVTAADRPAPRLEHARRTGLVAGPVHNHLVRGLDVLDVALPERTDPEPRPPTRELRELLSATAHGRDYPDCVSALLAVEWLHLDCATRPHAEPPTEPLQREWIELRRGPSVEAWVAFLRLEVERVGAVDDGRRRRTRELFARTAALELDLLDSAYA